MTPIFRQLWRSAILFVLTFLTAPVSAVGAPDGMDSFFQEVPIAEGVLLNDPFSRLSDVEKENLVSAKSVLTEFLRRVIPGNDRTALDLVSEELREQYGTDDKFYLSHFKSEGIVSYRVIRFFIVPEGDALILEIMLREAVEGEEYGKQRSASLRRTPGGWRITGFD